MKKIDMEALRKIVGQNNVTDNPVDLYEYSSDESVHQAMPHVVIRPKTIQEVQKIMQR